MPKQIRSPVRLNDQPVAEQGRARIYQLNLLPVEEKRKIYASLIPPQLLTRFQIDPETLRNAAGEEVFTCRDDPKTAEVRIELRHHADFEDPIFLLEMQDTPFGDVAMLFLNINNPSAERFQIDRDLAGNDTAFATLTRNIPEELRAMQAGLAPGQIRKGLQLFRSFWQQAQQFGQKVGIQRVKVEPLAYHNAIMHEFYGFRYLAGRDMMEQIDQDFAPGGRLFERLDGSSPFRQPILARSIRGRSWAIHDGILGEPWQCPRMYYTLDAPPDRQYAPLTCRTTSRYYDTLA